MLKYGKGTATTDETGLAILALKIPGTFAGIDSKLSTWSGRKIYTGEIWFANGTDGDHIKDLTVEDTDGLIPEPLRAAFPLYPVLGSRNDLTLDEENQGVYMNPNSPTSFAPPQPGFTIASGLYIYIKVQKATAEVDTVYANFSWDDLT